MAQINLENILGIIMAKTELPKISKTKTNFNFMLCQLGAEQFLEQYESRGQKVESKIDGTRVALIKDSDGRIGIPNRRAVNYADFHNLPELEDILSLFPNDTIVDGEVYALDNEGKVSRILTQTRCGTKIRSEALRKAKLVPVYVYGFDMLRLAGKDLERSPYLERKNTLKDFVKEISHPNLNYLGYESKDFRTLFNAEPEGLVVKVPWAPYVHDRSFYWLKVKHTDVEVVNVVGWTSGEGKNSELFGSLVCMLNGQYVGNCGGGFTDAERIKVAEIVRKAPRLFPEWKLSQEVTKPFTRIQTDLKLEVLFQEKTAEKNHFFCPRMKRIIWPKNK